MATSLPVPRGDVNPQLALGDVRVRPHFGRIGPRRQGYDGLLAVWAIKIRLGRAQIPKVEERNDGVDRRQRPKEQLFPLCPAGVAGPELRKRLAEGF